MSLRGRLEQLERAKDRAAPKANALAWDVLYGFRESTAAEDRAFAEFLVESERKRAAALETSPAGILYRQELERLGQVQPANLLEVDESEGIITAALRLVATEATPCTCSP